MPRSGWFQAATRRGCRPIRPRAALATAKSQLEGAKAELAQYAI